MAARLWRFSIKASPSSCNVPPSTPRSAKPPAQSLRGQCAAAGVPMFFKQAGGNPTRWNEFEKRDAPLFLTDRKGGDPTGWPEAMPREFPKAEASHA